jgi:hypothetical protein
MVEQQTPLKANAPAGLKRVTAKDVLREVPRWSARKWLTLIVGFFILQLGFVYLVADRSIARPDLKQPRIFARTFGGNLTEELVSQSFFASDPLLFPLASQHGFSGSGWMTVNRLPYELPDEIEPPQWLALHTANLGRVAPSEPKTDLPFELGQKSTPQTEALPVFVPSVSPQTNSFVRVDGNLHDRAVGLPMTLPAWPSINVLSNSVVELAVDGAGEVVARRLASPSGSKDADRAALEKTKLLRFRPMNAVGTIWGQAIFEWATSEPPEGPQK